jgi:homoserine kinase
VDQVTVRVPASTANLGSGYDAFGLALSCHNTVTARLAPADQWTVELLGDCPDRPRAGRENLIARAMWRVFSEVGERGGASISCTNGVPFGRGLGSSSAAIVAGLVAANELLGSPLAPLAVFRLAVELEGHPDNVAAALFGGFTICWHTGGVPQCTHIDPPRGLAAVCVVSDARLATRQARSLLPAEVPHADAAFDAGRAGLLAAGIALGRHELFGPGMDDRLHEPYRAAAIADLFEVREALLEAGADGAALSGAGPTVLGLVGGDDDADALERACEVASRAGRLLAGCAGRRVPEVMAIDRDGAVVA